MYRQLLYLTLLAVVAHVVLISGSTAYGFDANNDPSLVGWWALDDGSGTVAVDSSPSGNDGDLNGDPVWVVGYLDGALEFDGTDDYVDTGWAENLATYTISAWVTSPAAPSTAGSPSGPLHREGNYQINWDHGDGTYAGSIAANIGGWTSASLGTLEGDTWYHLCGTYDGSSLNAYVNGELTTETSVSGTPAAESNTLKLGRHAAAAQYFAGTVDDARVYNRALTLEEIQQVMAGGIDSALASAPSPEDGATDIPLDVTLGWAPGEFAPAADGHKVYFGDVFEDVNNGDASTDRGVVSDPSYSPTGLDYGTTYYWRVDEANNTTGWDVGMTWNFTTEPYAYPVEGVVVTTNTTAGASQSIESIVDGSGLNENDEHSIDSDDMWSGSPPAGEAAWLQFELPRTYKLHEMQVWNYNHSFEMFLGVSAQDVTIEYSVDGAEWTVLESVTLPQGPGSATYTGTAVELGDVPASLVRMTIDSGYGTTPMVGLSEVRFTYIPAHAREPQPADGAANVAIDTVLDWRAGRDAVSYDVQLTEDPNTLAIVATTTETGYAAMLDLDSTYYWQVDASDGAVTWDGDLWTFTTQEYIVIDDFESYIDDEAAGDVIWEAWIDGLVEFGGDAANGGSQVGHNTSPFAEQTIVHEGDQSMPLYFTNTSASAISEADLTLSPAQDWSANGIQSLSLWFYGAEGNTGSLYVKINDVKITYDGAADDIAALAWQPWNIDLSAVNTNLSNVSTLSVGVEGAGSGVVYVDDIRLYGRTGDAATPVQPDSADLVLHYMLDEGAGAVCNDASGNGNNGTIVGNPSWVTGQSGSALQFAGLSDYISTDEALLDSLATFSICCWIQGDFSTASRMGLIGQNDCVEYGFSAANNLQIWTPNGGAVNAPWPYGTDEWHHVATVGYGEVTTVYVDGRPIVSGGTAVEENYGTSSYTVNIGGGGVFDATGNWFAGLIDDIRIYQRALSAGEVAGMAGRTAPVYGEI